MSEVYEGIVYRVQPNTSAPKYTYDKSSGVWAEDTLGDGVVLVGRIDARDSPDAAGEQIARQISLVAPTVYFQFDSRTGKRFASVFDRGESIRLLSETDETFIPLDEEGLPMDTQPLAFHELDPQGEYETLQNAIEIALSDIGCDVRWGDLKQRLFIMSR